MNTRIKIDHSIETIQAILVLILHATVIFPQTTTDIIQCIIIGNN